MKRLVLLLTGIVAVFTTIAFIFSSQSFAQMKYEEITEGKEYWFGLPLCNRETGEAIRGNYPIAIWISSKVDTRATVEDAETGSMINVVIRANQITEVPYGDAVMMKESEVVKNFGIHVKADDPISVAVYMSYRWSGEAYRVTPVEWLGRQYVTLNLYQDKTDKYLPCQILIIASENGTNLTYIPTAETEKAKEGTVNQVVLNKGQTFLILNKIIPGLTQDDATDLTGTFIKANKPFAVISGHTKGAFPKYQYTFLGRPGNFMRNMMIDMCWPIELLGTTYVSAPIKYADRPRNQIQDDKGDLIRFVAPFNDTYIYQLRSNATDTINPAGWMQISKRMMRSEWHDIVNQEMAAMYKANKPVLVGQYGKTWWLYPVSPSTDKGGETPQNPSRNGQGMLLVLAPMNHWTSYATWRSPAQIDDFIYVTFNAQYLHKLKYDGVPFTAKFGNAVKYIAGTDFAYLVESVAAGDHWIEGDTILGGKAKATFAAYAYGNWDRSKDGFAYGYPIGINYNTPCEDSIYIKPAQYCENASGEVVVTPLTSDTSCAGIHNVVFVADSSKNYEFFLDDNFISGVKKTKYTLKVIDMTKYAKALVRAQTRSGKSYYQWYEYIPEEIAAVPTFIDFGLLQPNKDNPCKTFTLNNPGTGDVTVKELKLKYGRVEFTINSKDLPVTLKPGEKKDIEVCAKALALGPPVKDSIIAVMSCYEKTIVGLMLTTGEPIVWIGDADWGQLPVGKEEWRIIDIVNKSNVDVELTSIDWKDKTHFKAVRNLPFPNKLLLKPGERTTFEASYMPDQPKIKNYDTAWFVGNTQKDKLFSLWVGSGIMPGPAIVGYDWKFQRVIDQWQLDHGITKYDGKVVVSNDPSASDDISVDSVAVENDADGVFSIDKSYVPSRLTIGQSVDIPATFIPKAEKTYDAKVVMYCHDQLNQQHIRESYLKGIGQQPHIWVSGIDYGTPLDVKNGASKQDLARIDHITNVNPMNTSISKIEIQDVTGYNDASAFTIDPSYLADPTKWQSLLVGKYLQVPITFKPTHQGVHKALLITSDDAPISTIDRHYDTLVGSGYLMGLQTTPYDFPRIYISKDQDNGTVTLTNIGQTPVSVLKDPYVKGDATEFQINRYRINGNDPGKAPFTLDAGQTLTTYLKYSPNQNGVFTKEMVDALPDNLKFDDDEVIYDIEYQDPSKTRETLTSKVSGSAMIYKLVIGIPSGYTTLPGKQLEVDYLIQPNNEETKPLSEANISEMKIFMNFKTVGGEIFKDVYPVPADPKQFNFDNLVLGGTLLSGWFDPNDKLNASTNPNGNYANIIDNRQVEVHVRNAQGGSYLSGSGTLFKVRFNAYLSDLDRIPLVPELNVTGVESDRKSQNYIIIDAMPGDIKVNPVCVNTARLIKLAGVQASLAPASPNPASTSTLIEYAVPLDGYTNISLYNSNGQLVTTLVDGTLKAGYYELKLDVTALDIPSGTYYYRMNCEPFSDMKPLVINK